MSFEHFIAIWPAALEPQREWSMMETPYKKKINQIHFNSNIVRERTVLRMRDAKDNMFDTGGRWWTYIMSFYGGKNYPPFHFSPSVITRPLTPLPFASFASLFLFQRCTSSSPRVWSAWWAAVWLQQLQQLVLQVGSSLFWPLLWKEIVETNFSFYTPTPHSKNHWIKSDPVWVKCTQYPGVEKTPKTRDCFHLVLVLFLYITVGLFTQTNI